MEATRIRLEAIPSNQPTPTEEADAPAPTPTKRPPRNGWRRLIRWLIGGAMLAEAAWLIMPSVLYRTSVRASVTAPSAVVRVHQPGVIVGTPPEVGARVSAGQVLFEVREASPDRRPSEQFRAEAESVRRAADAIRGQLAELDELKETLKAHFDEYRKARVARAEAQLAEQRARVEAAESRLREAELELRLQGRLSSRGASSEFERSRAEAALEVARDELEEARMAEERHRLQLDSARSGVFVGEADGGQDRVASLQRCDEIEMQQMGLRARLGELGGKLAELEARLEGERRHLEEGRLRVVSPMGGIVWSSSLSPDVEVTPGATALEIVDPDRLGIEALFKEADAARVRPGTPVEARLLGSSLILPGRVVRVTDPGAVDPRTMGQIPRDSVPPGTFRAIIELEVQPDGGDPANRHHIGGPAIVWTKR
ncbi:HlyD family secretion protein [Tautonia sociabilis]|uniref:HlyD family efflux transporter periplasmic adaptor subunit n=1 Tax=Tautonia sociabilis TaxID=2080755 RepID=A0A432MER5_9BACT|nr:HlyD family efflux transporter periplasmic adaptor subunit [Tautonia sociabilis]RUL84173.1 HlyD family efflux transporter periplasmic adaptor subunit [Tautonia sociabilis]